MVRDASVTRPRHESDRMMPAGQPRTGDAAYADLLETTFGREHIFRGRSFLLRGSILATDTRHSKPFIHGVPPCHPFISFHAADDLLNTRMTDGVPTMIPESLQYVCFHVSARNFSSGSTQKQLFTTAAARASIGNSMNRVSWHRETKLQGKLSLGTYFRKIRRQTVVVKGRKTQNTVVQYVSVPCQAGSGSGMNWFSLVSSTASTGINLAHGVYFGQGMCTVSGTVFGPRADQNPFSLSFSRSDDDGCILVSLVGVCRSSFCPYIYA